MWSPEHGKKLPAHGWMLPGDGDSSLGKKQTFFSAFSVIWVLFFFLNSVGCPKQTILHPLSVVTSACLKLSTPCQAPSAQRRAFFILSAITSSPRSLQN